MINFGYKQYKQHLNNHMFPTYSFNFLKMKPQEKMFFKDPVKLVQTRLEHIAQVIFCLSNTFYLSQFIYN